MKVNVKCFASLSEKDSCNFKTETAYTIEPGNNVGDLIDRVDLPTEEVSLVFVNGRKRSTQTALSDGDRVGLFPAVGGM